VLADPENWVGLEASCNRPSLSLVVATRTYGGSWRRPRLPDRGGGSREDPHSSCMHVFVRVWKIT